MSPKVSICIPTYNNKEGVERLLKSIIEQDFTNYEIVISDDSDNDEIQELLKRMYMENAQYIKNEKRLGATANCNKSIDMANGSYIKIMHHDDWFSDEKSLKKFVELLDENPNASMAFSGTYQVGRDKRKQRCTTKKQISSIRRNPYNLFLGNRIGAPSATIYRRSEKRFDENLKWLVDLEFYTRILQDNKKFAFTPDPLISIGLSEKQLSESCVDSPEVNCFEHGYVFEKFNLGRFMVYRKHLIEVFIKFEKKYSDLQKYKIMKIEFWYVDKLKKIKKKRMLLFK